MMCCCFCFPGVDLSKTNMSALNAVTTLVFRGSSFGLRDFFVSPGKKDIEIQNQTGHSIPETGSKMSETHIFSGKLYLWFEKPQRVEFVQLIYYVPTSMFHEDY